MSKLLNVTNPDRNIMLRFEFSFKEHAIEEIRNIEPLLKDVVEEVCEKYNYHIEKLEISDGTVILETIISVFVTPIDVVRNIKSNTLIGIMKECSTIKKMYGKKGTIWNEKYVVKSMSY